MKNKIFISFILLICPFLTAQNNPFYIALHGAVEKGDTTYLYYSTSISDPQNRNSTLRTIFKLNCKSFQEEVYRKDINFWSGGNLRQDQIATDIEFLNADEDKYLIAESFYSNPGMWNMSKASLYLGSINILTLQGSIWDVVAPNVECSAQNPQKIYFSAINGFNNFNGVPQKNTKYLIRSSDGGTTWEYLPADFTLVSVNKNDDNLLFGIKDGKLLLAESKTSLPYIIKDSTCVWDDPLVKFHYSKDKKHIYTKAKKGTSNILMISEDNGNTWNQAFSCTDPICICLDDNRISDVYYSAGKKIFYSSDYGKNFSLFNEVSDNILGLYKEGRSNNIFAIGGYKRFIVTELNTKIIISSFIDK